MDDIEIETIKERAEFIAREFLGVSAEEAWKMFENNELVKGSVAEEEFKALKWLKGE